MPTQVIMPQLGESVVEGTVSRWLKQVGDEIREYEPLVEISTDKVETEIPSPASGTVLEIRVGEGQTVGKGTLLALIGMAGEQPATEVPSHNAFPAHASNGAPHVTPVVARMVAENKLSLEAIPGTGRGGRVTKKDVEAYLAKQRQPAPDLPLEPWEQPGSGDLFKESAPYAAPVASSPAVISREQAAPRADGQLVPLTAMRRSIAEHMQRSVQTAPHVTTIFEVDMAAVLAHRAASLRAAEQAGIRLTLSAYFAAAAASALMQHPTLNARWTDEGILEHRDVHLGMAVALDEGLIVPVIERAQERNLLGLARAIHDLAERARQRKLRPEETRGGTFTISNHGVSGSLVATPIINQPQSGILGIGRVEKRVRVLTDAQGNDSIAIRPCCYASLTFDHRVTDGAGADAFMSTFRALLEGWR